MKNLGYKKKQNSSINQKIRNAEFVPLDSENKERFKYCKRFYKDIGLAKAFLMFKQWFNKNTQRASLLTTKVDWPALRNDFGEYLLEASIEGVAINFALHFVFGLPFTILTAIAYGVGYKQIIAFYWRLKTNGQNQSILKKS